MKSRHHGWGLKDAANEVKKKKWLTQSDRHPMRAAIIISLLPLTCCGCSVLAVADAAVSVAATTVKAGATVVGTAVDVAADGVKAVATSSDDSDNKKRLEASER
jgi:hypothetical protein